MGTVAIIIGAMLAAALLATLAGRTIESYNWNKGKCRKCGGDLVYFDTDSQGGRGYRCKTPGCGRAVWISYNGIDKRG